MEVVNFSGWGNHYKFSRELILLEEGLDVGHNLEEEVIVVHKYSWVSLVIHHTNFSALDVLVVNVHEGTHEDESVRLITINNLQEVT
jgi:hypothetical protein